MNLVAVVKEVAPTKTAKTDVELGLAEFTAKYFNYPTYLDEGQAFYDALGNRQITKDLEGTFNPIKLFQGLKEIGQRIKDKDIEQVRGGNGIVLGGIIIVDPNTQKVDYVYKEQTGKEIPVDEIVAACKGPSMANSFATKV